MKLFRYTTIAVSITLSAVAAQAQSGGQQSLAGKFGIYVFPSAGQSAEQQSEDEAACYKWAVSNSGVDPFEVQKQEAAGAQQAQAAEQQAAQSGKGSGARGAVGGAAVGALIGEIADDDAGKGAAYGAAAGLLGGRLRASRHEQAAQQQAQTQYQQSQQASEAQLQGFKKAFSACMEGKQYIAKF